MLSLSGWSLEQCIFDKKTKKLFVRLAFGDDENSKSFVMNEIYVIYGPNLNKLYQRAFMQKKTEVIKKEYTMMGLIKDEDSEK